jgi:SAM-dependent methyltransferase
MTDTEITEASALRDNEADEARRYWASRSLDSNDRAQSWSTAIAEHILAMNPRSVFEFGCSSGTNLRALGERGNAFLSGVDVNLGAVDHAQSSGLNVALGDQRSLPLFPNNTFDVSFTISTLDHVPDPGPTLAQLGRISQAGVVLLEPWLGREGRVETYVDPATGRREPSPPYYYSWDYQQLASTYLPGWSLTDEPFEIPTDFGRFCRLITLRPPATSGRRRRRRPDVARKPVPVPALDWAAQRIEALEGFAAARCVVELGCGDASRSIALAVRHPDIYFIASDYPIAEEVSQREDLPPNLELASIDAMAIDLDSTSTDLVFSVAVMEHIAGLDSCLAETHRILRPGGTHYYIQAPFWSCAQGHHFRHWDDTTFEFIPKYAHLTMTPEALGNHLAAGPQPPFDIDECIARIYHRDDLSRLGRDKTKAIVANSRFDIASWEDYPDRRYDEMLADAAFPRLLEPLRREELGIGGAYIRLRRPLADT